MDTKMKINIIANVLIVLALGILVLTFLPIAKQELKYKVEKVSNVVYSLDPLPNTNEKKLIPPDTDFSIVIPKLGVAEHIFADVNPFDSNEYLPVVRKGIAHAKGSAHPGEVGNIYLFAHSTDAFYNVGRYNAVFYLIGKLEKNDPIFIFYEGNKFEYNVTDKKVVDNKETKYLGNFEVGNTLTLQTCYPPGTTLKRLVVVAKQKTQ